ncbi:MAG: phosphatase PAP2 family protein [Prevotella sp.]|nr:phosphatase PAP2 family protein [Prevotella sp.]
MKEKQQIFLAKAVSLIFAPSYLPLVGLAALFFFSYLKIMPWQFKFFVLLQAYIFTILLPSLLIRFYRRAQGWHSHEIGPKERLMVPYIITIICYFTCYYTMNSIHIPHVISSILLAALAIQIVCAIVNVAWKISAHSATIGGFAGALVAYSFKWSFNPIWWLCLIIVVGGLVSSARMILRHHTLAQVVGGFGIGFICAFYTIFRI